MKKPIASSARRRGQHSIPSRSEGQLGRRVSLALAGALAVGLVSVSTGVANAAPPEFPDNIVVFPDRDFVTIEGFRDRAGQLATLEVTRPGVGVIGSAIGTVSGEEVAFEVNHPGGYCWGAGTGLKITPDIQGNDVVTIKFGGKSAGDTTVADVAVTAIEYTEGSADLRVVGRAGSAVNKDQLEQRVVNPSLKDTAVGRRDVRAVPGPVVTAPKGGYSSGLDVAGSTFTATYKFDTAALAATTAGSGGARIMSWQVQDADANRQGLTIAEFGELGGPGMGGCPNGPLASGPVGPTDVTATKVGGGYKLTWTPAVPVPGTPAITGYEVSAISTPTGNEQAVVGKRISGQGAKTTTLNGLTGDQDFEIVSISSTGKTFPAVTVHPETDSTPPIITASPAGGTFKTAQLVTLQSNEANTDIYYTTDPDLDLANGDAVSSSATHYTGAIAVPASATLRWVALDPASNVSNGDATYVITEAPTPDAPTPGALVLGAGTVTVNWTSTDPSVIGYNVQAFNAAGVAFENAQLVTASPATISGLQGGESYTVQVSAKNANGFGDPAILGPFTALGAFNANAGPDQEVRRSATAKVTLDASASTGAKTYKWEQVLTGTNDPDKVALTGDTTAKPTFVYPMFKYPMTNNALTFRLTVNDGNSTKTDEVKVTATPDKVTISSAKFKSGDFRISGTNPTVGAVITVRSAANPATVLGTATVTAAAAPATGGVWELRLRTGTAATTNPGRIVADSNFGGTTGAFQVTT